MSHLWSNLFGKDMQSSLWCPSKSGHSWHVQALSQCVRRVFRNASCPAIGLLRAARLSVLFLASLLVAVAIIVSGSSHISRCLHCCTPHRAVRLLVSSFSPSALVPSPPTTRLSQLANTAPDRLCRPVRRPLFPLTPSLCLLRTIFCCSPSWIPPVVP